VYVERVTKYAAYVLSLPDQGDTKDSRFLGPTSAIVTSPFVDFYTIDEESLSEKNKTFLSELRETESVPYVVQAPQGKTMTMLSGRNPWKVGDVVMLTKHEAIVLGSAVRRQDEVDLGDVDRVASGHRVGDRKKIPDLEPLHLEPLTEEGLGGQALAFYKEIVKLGTPTIDQVPNHPMKTIFIDIMLKKKNIRWIDVPKLQE
jgi:hypothetical protein